MELGSCAGVDPAAPTKTRASNAGRHGQAARPNRLCSVAAIREFPPVALGAVDSNFGKIHEPKRPALTREQAPAALGAGQRVSKRVWLRHHPARPRPSLHTCCAYGASTGLPL